VGFARAATTMAQERTERATQHRRQRFRQRGRVACSRDLTAALALLGAFAALRLLGPWMYRVLAGDTTRIILSAGSPSVNQAELAAYARVGFWMTAKIAGPVLAGAAIGALAGSWLQTGFLVSLYPLVPSAEKINPLNGLKRLFSWEGLFDTVKSLVKMGLMLLVAWWTLAPRTGVLLSLGLEAPAGAVSGLVDLATLVTLRCGLAMLVLGAADYAFQWWLTERQMMMTRQEMREEWKETEGDPVTRMRRRQRRRELLEQRILSEMREATVVLTNPTHVAVALEYGRGYTAILGWRRGLGRDSGHLRSAALAPRRAPRVVAKGRGHVAERIAALARTYNVPIVENVALARAIYRAVRVGDDIPRALYQAVAEILALIYRREAARQERIRRGRGGDTGLGLGRDGGLGRSGLPRL